MTRQVLLLNSDKPEVLDVLARRPDVTVRVITRKVYAHLYAHLHEGCDVAYVDEFGDLPQVARAAYDLTARAPVDHVVAATEKSVLAAGLVRGLLGTAGASFDQSLWATHKRAMKDRLRAAGLPVTDHAQAGTLDDVPRAAESTGWPVVVKPVLGSGSRSTYRVDSAEELAERHRAGDLADLADTRLPVQVERVVDFSAEYHCEGVLFGGEVARAAVSRYFLPPLHIAPSLNSGYVVDQSEPFARDVLDLHRQVVAALGLRTGITHLEVFRTDAGPVIGEVAIRPPGLGVCRMWWHAFGLDLWEEFVRVSIGERPGPPAHAPRPETVGRSRLPERPGLREEVLALPGVLEVRTPEECATPGRLEVHFTAADEAAAEVFIARLHETAASAP